MANLHQILFEASLGWGKGCIRFGGRSDENSGFHGNRKLPLTYNGENGVDNYFIFDRSFVVLAGNEDSHKISDQLDFRPNRTIHFGVTRPWATKNFPLDLQWRKCCLDDSFFTFDRIFINLAGNQDSHKILDEIECRSDQTIHFGVTCPLVAKKPIFDLVRSIVPSILIGFSSNLQVTGTAINSRMGSNFGQIRLFTSELLALESRKSP